MIAGINDRIEGEKGLTVSEVNGVSAINFHYLLFSFIFLLTPGDARGFFVASPPKHVVLGYTKYRRESPSIFGGFENC